MKKDIKEICKLTFKVTNYLAAKKTFKDLTEDDVDQLAEAIELLNDIYEELYDQVFEK